MTVRQTDWPRAWLMTDERMGERLWDAIARVPQGRGGVVFRHYSLGVSERLALGERIAELCDERDLILAVAADVALARLLGADLVHNPAEPPHGLPFSRPVHSLEEAQAARIEGASLVFVSPIYPTRSHPERMPVPPEVAREIARAAGVPAIALGGMDEERFAQLEREGFYGWAGIDAWLRT